MWNLQYTGLVECTHGGHMFSDEVCPFSHEGPREVVHNSKKVDKSRAVVRLIPNIG